MITGMSNLSYYSRLKESGKFRAEAISHRSADCL